MYCRVLACDFDGTGAYDGRLAPEVAAVLHDARRHGVRTLLVTGRVLEELQMAGVDMSIFDAVVAENGALIWFPARDRVLQLADPPPDALLAALRDAGVPFQAGAVVIGTWDQHANQLVAVLRRLGLDQQLIFNRAAVMLLPSGVNKAVGVERVLAEFGGSRHNMVAFGDAENDIPLLLGSEVGVAARGAVPTVAALADERLSHPDGEGIATFVRRLLADEWALPTPARHRIAIGTGVDGGPVTLPTGANVLISGAPRSGKSWLGGLVAEQLLERRYRLCVIDPEGDHAALGTGPDTLVLGRELPLPSPDAVAHLVGEKPWSVIVSLAALDHDAKCAYVDALLCALDAVRAAQGVPHWILVDEAHYFFHTTAPCARRFDDHTGSYCFLTYRPSMLAGSVIEAVDAHLVMHTEVDDERYFLTSLLQSVVHDDRCVADCLERITNGMAGLATRDGFDVFVPARRNTPHVHHARKYVDEDLPDQKAFHFQLADGMPPARNVRDFCRSVTGLPTLSLQHHLTNGDFSRWVRDVLGDTHLAAGLHKLEATVRAGGRPNALEIVQHVRARYAT